MDAELQWVKDSLRGDQRAFVCLVDAYKVPVYNLCYRMLGNASDAEDAAQETFVRIYTHLQKYNPEQKLSSWILSVAAHYCIDRLRRRRFTLLSFDEALPAEAPADEWPRPEDDLIANEARAEVRGLLQALPAEYRLVIVMRYWEELSYAEMAQAAGTTESAVKSRLHRARAVLAEQVRARRRREVQPGCQVDNGKRVMKNAVL